MYLIAALLFFVGVWLTVKALRPRMIYWGSTVDERLMPMPNTERLKNVRIMDTHAITINAPVERVWAFLVQVGQNRGGFYSYRLLENLVGCKMPSVDRIVPELQELKLGDKVFLHPKAPPLTVTVLEPNKALALEGWYLTLQSKGPNETRLVTRSYDWRDPFGKSKIADLVLSGVFFDFAHFIMERKMLLNIKELAEFNLQKTERRTWLGPVWAWFGLLVLAFINGALREVGMKQLMGIQEPLAHQLSCLTGVFLWTLFLVLIWNRLKISTLEKSLWVGAGWLAATALFETFVLNRNLSWTEILQTYNFLQGEFWGLALLWIGLMPIAFFKIYGQKPLRGPSSLSRA